MKKLRSTTPSCFPTSSDSPFRPFILCAPPPIRPLRPDPELIRTVIPPRSRTPKTDEAFYLHFLCARVSVAKHINQVIHILHDLNTSPQHFLRLTKTASRLVERHLLLDKAFILFILRKSAMCKVISKWKACTYFLGRCPKRLHIRQIMEHWGLPIPVVRHLPFLKSI